VAYGIGYAQRQPNASLVPDLSTHLLFVHTWFPDRFGTINGVLWTLAVEVEFYCIFPLVWWCFARRPLGTAAAMIAIAWLWRSGLASCCYSTLFTAYEENLPGYLDIFAFGMLGAYAFSALPQCRHATVVRRIAPAVAAGGVVLCIVLMQGLYAYRFADQWAGVWQVDRRPLLGAAFFFIAIGSLLAPRWWQLLLDNPPLRYLAAISYNLYLYHQMVARELFQHGLPYHRGDPHQDPQWQARYTALAAVVSLVIASVTTYAVERPILQLRFKNALRKR
jgi:peptidoglycan/LPS O-acetylase OafA/YrhL